MGWGGVGNFRLGVFRGEGWVVWMLGGGSCEGRGVGGLGVGVWGRFVVRVGPRAAEDVA
jgi:hypothetical protein